MRIAFDFHGVLNTYSKKFKLLMEHLKLSSNIYILSGPPYEQINNELEKFKYLPCIHYDQIISVVDWIKKSGVEMKQHPDGSWYCDDKTWWISKTKICEEYEIDILFDDKLEYKETMDQNKTLFCHVK